MAKTKVYTITIEVDEQAVNAAAAHLIPRLIRDFGVAMKVKMALVTSLTSWKISATETVMGMFGEEEKDFPLVPNEDLDNPER